MKMKTKTCLHNSHSSPIINRELDPTRTLTLRNTFARQMSKRFNELSSFVVRAIVDRDVFGLNFQANLELPPQNAFNFTRSDEKITAFMKWLKDQEQAGILELTRQPQIGTGVNQGWTNVFIESSYQKGITRARQEMIRAGHNVPTMEQTGGVRIAFNQAAHADRAGLLFTRVFNDLEGVTTAMDTQISRVLSQGLIEGKNPRTLARELNKIITGRGENLDLTDTLGRFIPGKRRAEMLARTEIIRSHHSAMVQEYRNWGVQGVNVKAEFRTAGDSRVCSICAGLEGRVFTLEEAESVIPQHVSCRCITLPLEVKLSKAA